jgi:pimeloyl-ACP methyl ester carboxylesterase
MADQLSDISSFVRGLPQEPVMIGHSIGGVIAQRYLAKLSQEGTAQLSPIVGAALLANAGPREFMPKLRWFQSQRSLWHAARVFLWMLKRPVHDRRLVREMFFSDDLPEQDFQRYHQHLAAAPQLVPITGKDMKQPVTLGPHTLPPVVAIGGADDGIVMEYQLRDAADFFGARAVVVPGLAHDLMLDTRWELAASILLEWVMSLRPASEAPRR